MRRWLLPAATITAILAGCASSPPGRTLAGLRDVEPDTRDIPVEQGLERAMDSYRRFLEETPESELTPEAMRRLADLQVEKEFGLRAGDGKPREMAAPERAERVPTAQGSAVATVAGVTGERTESDLEFENRTTVEQSVSFAE
ncbi:MAG TPA: hypothetical protein VLA38_05305, partial [Steroidobacteraceae bacterium]|nr:hypothetical protein [Steroidobacteraceae bacterium]